MLCGVPYEGRKRPARLNRLLEDFPLLFCSGSAGLQASAKAFYLSIRAGFSRRHRHCGANFSAACEAMS